MKTPLSRYVSICKDVARTLADKEGMPVREAYKEFLGITAERMTLLDRGNGSPTFEQLLRLSEYGINLNYIATGKGDPYVVEDKVTLQILEALKRIEKKL